MSRACIFVDGENFRHSICEIFNAGEFDARDYLPKDADWAGFFDWLVDHACIDHERLRTYWYVLEGLDFFPYKFPNARRESDSLRITLSKDKQIAAQLDRLQGAELTKRMDQIAGGLKAKQQSFLARFRGWHVVQDGISNKHRAIEFRRAGSSLYNLFTGKMGIEKAVDVMLATDLLMLKDIYDVAILVSGDQDYVPAVRRVKDFGKTVINVAFLTRNGRLLPGGARRLNNATDASVQLPFEDLRQHLCPGYRAPAQAGIVLPQTDSETDNRRS
jgi:uncharacterized LabA/DUF88 family protein